MKTMGDSFIENGFEYVGDNTYSKLDGEDLIEATYIKGGWYVRYDRGGFFPKVTREYCTSWEELVDLLKDITYWED